jgi:hypothetical protein
MMHRRPWGWALGGHGSAPGGHGVGGSEAGLATKSMRLAQIISQSSQACVNAQSLNQQRRIIRSACRRRFRTSHDLETASNISQPAFQAANQAAWKADARPCQTLARRSRSTGHAQPQRIQPTDVYHFGCLRTEQTLRKSPLSPPGATLAGRIAPGLEEPAPRVAPLMRRGRGRSRPEMAPPGRAEGIGLVRDDRSPQAQPLNASALENCLSPSTARNNS